MTNMTETMIHGFRASRLSPLERESLLIRRTWTRAERRIVLHGFLGRLTIAIEPVICASVFLALTLGMVFNKNKEIIILAPIFALGVIAFAAYAFIVMCAPVRALLHTLGPIYIVDGYVRYRGRDAHSEDECNGYIAVLTEDKRVACEWPTLGFVELAPHVRAAMSEFSEYGGVHKIDGRPTGVLPERIASLGVGGLSRAREFTE
ncbi:MAG: hypothetical protein NVS2B17_30710 [Candidatus Velthaea sp.]